MNEKELLELLAEQAPLPPADYPLRTLRRARRARRVRGFAIGSGTLAVVALLLLTQVVLRPGGGPSLPPAQPDRTHTGVVYLKEPTTTQQRSAVQSTLQDTPGVSKVRFVTKDEAYERFKTMFKDAPEMLESVRPAEMPESYEFEASAATDRRDLLYRMRALPGVSFAASPIPREITAYASPSSVPAPEMGLPEAQMYAEQLILLATTVWQHPTPPKTVYLVDGFCQHDANVRPGCPPQRFSPLLRSELQSRVSHYAAVVFVQSMDRVDPAAPDALVVNLGPLASHDTADQTWWLDIRSAERSEYAQFEVVWNGERWIVGQWTAGMVSTTSP